MASSLVTLSGCPTVSAPPVEDGACTDSGWCWVRGRPLTVVGDRARGVVLAIGDGGAFARWEADHWAFLPSPTSRALVSGWSASASDAWASDLMGSAWHWDGARWSEAPATTWISRVMGASDGTAWAMAGGEGGGHGGVTGARLLRRDGDGWSEPIPAPSYCIGGDYLLTSSGEVWSAGLVCDASGIVTAAEVRRFDGGAWVLIGAPIEGEAWYPSLEETPEGVALTVQSRFRWDGRAWIDAPLPLYPQDLAIGESAYFDGFRYTRVPTSLGCEGIYRADETHAWCWGAGRISIERASAWVSTLPVPFEETSDASAWGTVPVTLWAGSDALLAWGPSPSDVYRVRPSAGRALEHFDGTGWSIVSSSIVIDLAGTAAGEVWVATSEGVLRGQGGTMERETMPTSDAVEHVAVLGDGTIVATTRSEVWVTQGRGWQSAFTADPSVYVVDVAGASTSTMWILEHGQGRTNDMDLRHGDGAGSYPLVTPPITLVGIGTLEMGPEGAWLDNASALASLETGETIEGVPFYVYEGTITIDADEIWVTNAYQAARRSR